MSQVVTNEVVEQSVIVNEESPKVIDINMFAPKAKKAIDAAKVEPLTDEQEAIFESCLQDLKQTAQVNRVRIDDVLQHNESFLQELKKLLPDFMGKCKGQFLEISKIEVAGFYDLEINLTFTPVFISDDLRFEFIEYGKTDGYNRSENHAKAYNRVKVLREIFSGLETLGFSFDMVGTMFLLTETRTDFNLYGKISPLKTKKS